MNRVTWIRIGIVTAVVAVGTFAIWKAISPEEQPKLQASKGTEKSSDSKDEKKPTETKPAEGDVDPFAAARKSFGANTAIPAAYISEGDDSSSGDEHYSSAANTGQENSQSAGADPFANRNMLPAGDRYANSDRYQGYTANSPGSATAGDSAYSGYDNATTGQDYDPLNPSTAGSATTGDTDQAGNPLRATDNGTDPFDNGGGAAGDRYSTTARDGSLYGGIPTGADAAQSGMSSADASQEHDPFASSRREPAHFGADDPAQMAAAKQGGADSAAGSALNGYVDRYQTGASPNSAANNTIDQPLPGQSATSMAGTGLGATGAVAGAAGDAFESYGTSRATQGATGANADPFDRGVNTTQTQQNTAGGYDPRQQPGPDYYGGATAGAGQQSLTNANTQAASSRSGFDPFADNAQSGGYAPQNYGGQAYDHGAAGGYVDSGIGEPGDENLEGPQSPQVVIHKSAPSEIQVGKPAIFEIVVRNEGNAIAHDVQVHDQVPRGTQLLRTSPVAQDNGRGSLVWDVGNIPPREERIVKMELMPVAEGEIGSVATVHVAAAASVRTIATRPDLRLEVSAPPTVMIGDDVTLKIKVRNPGTGMANGIMITERVPQELRHDAGDLLEYEIGQLEPGGTRELELTLTAAKAGKFINTLQATGDAGLQAAEESRIEIIAPALQVDLQGPTKRYLERPATYTISVANPGTAAAKDVELVAHVPQGMDFLEADNYGEYDQTSRVVRWSLEELPAAQQGAVSVKLLPTESGEHRLTAEGSAQKDLFDRSERTLDVEGVAAILFEVVDVNDPIEVGAETTYEIRVLNQGSKVATNIQLEAVTPQEMRPIDGEGPTRAYVDGNRVTFEPLAKLAPRADTKYRIKVKGLQAGDLRLTVKLLANEMTAPVIKEESTRVYADQ